MSKFYSVDEVSSLIGVEADTIREWISAGKLTAARRAGEVVIRNNDVKRLMDEYGVAEDSGTEVEKSIVEREPTEQELTFAPPSVAAKAGAKNLAAAVSAASATSDRRRAVEETSQGIEQGLVLNNELSSIAIDYYSMYEQKLDDYEISLRYANMEKPLVSSAEGTSDSKSEIIVQDKTEDMSGLLEKSLDPLMRSQVRLLKMFNEFTSKAEKGSKPTSLPIPANVDKAVAHLGEKLDCLLESLAKNEQSLNDLKSVVDNISTNGVAVASDGDNTERLENLQQRYELLQKRYNNLRSEHDRYVAEHAENNSAANNDSILNRLEVLRGQLDSENLSDEDFAEKIVEYVNVLSKERDQLQKRCDSYEKKIQSQNALIEKGEVEGSELLKLREDFENLHSASEAMDAELNEARASLEELINENALLNEQLESLHSESEQDKEELRKVRSELVQAETNIKAAQAQVVELESIASEVDKIKDVEDLAESLRLENEKIAAELEEARGRIEVLEGERDSAQSQLEDSIAEMEKFHAEAEALQLKSAEVIEQAGEELEECKKLLQEREAKIAALEKENTAAAARLESEKNRLLRRINTLQAKNDALQAEIEESREFGDSGDVEAIQLRMQDQIDALNLELTETREQLELAKSSTGGQDLDFSAKEAEYIARESELAQQIEALLNENESLHNELSSAFSDPEKDRLLEEATNERVRLIEELDRTKQMLFEQKQLYERERQEWSDILAKQVKGEQPPAKAGDDGAKSGGFRLFRGRSNNF